ncbi:hypothetical protein [Burkholderia anthina]|uniref:Uncharacterized protein n=1 Tax=Burkholderia anthina TaxID=179879 RepID=A0AAW3PYU5_9BURK|nr:hypothetical protein [Burkholderia anthina]KWZ34750.1 hypothetical protein WS64_03965 [Burkholderia anthina]
MNLNDAKKLEEARKRAEVATAALKKQNDDAKAEILNKVATEFRDYFSAAGFTVTPAQQGIIAAIGQTAFKLELDASDRFGAFGLVKITPPAESKEDPATVVVVRKQRADSTSTTFHAKQLTPLEEMEKKAADYEAALQRPFPELGFVIQQAAPAKVAPYGARPQPVAAMSNTREVLSSFTEVLSVLYPTS